MTPADTAPPEGVFPAIDGYYALDSEWRFVAMNAVAEQHFGRTRSQLQGRSLWQETGRGSESAVYAAFRGAVDRGDAIRFEVESRVLPGRWFEVHAHPRAAGGLDVCFHDVTERREAERQLREQVAAARAAQQAVQNEKRRLEAVLNALPIGVAITDARGGDIQSNEAFDRIWRGPRPAPATVDDYASYKARWADTGAEVKPHEWASAIAVETGSTVVGQLMEIERFDGTRAFVSNSAAPVRDAAGRIVGSAVVIEDVTAMRQADAVIRESEDRYRRLFDHMAEGCFLADVICDKDGRPVDYRYVAANPALEPLTGLKHEEIIGKTVREVLPGVEDYWVETYGRAAFTSEPVRLENYARALGRYYSTTAYATRPGQFACLFSDITERKRAELETERLLAAVRDEKERLTALVNSISDEVWFSDAERQFTLVNASALREFAMTGPVGVESVVRSLEVFRSDGSPRPLEESPALRALCGEAVRDYEEIVRTPATGELRYREVNASPVTDVSGRIIGSVSVVRDITDRKRAEESVRASEERLRSILENMSEGLMLFDVQGNLIYQNPASLRIHGFEAGSDGKIDRSDLPVTWKAWNEDGRPIAFDEWPVSRVFRNERFQNQILHVERVETGQEFDGSYNGSPLHDSSGNLVGGFITIRDITEEIRAAKALRASEGALRDADRRKDEFIAILSHELRNPLAPIRYAIPILQSERLSDAAGRAISVIDRQAKHLTRLIDDLLDVARVTSGKIELRREQVMLRSLVTAAIEGATPAMAAVPHTLQVTVADERIWLHADAARLTQVLTNLLENSAKFTPSGGCIFLDAGREGDEAVVRVRDTGIGVPEDALPSVFEMFRQVGPVHGTQAGLGIGLAVAKRLVEMHNGTIEARSDGPGQGAEFVVRLPVAPEVEAEMASNEQGAGAGPVAGRRLKVLVVDDNVDLVEMLAFVVASAGHDVEKAYDGAGAVTKATTWIPDVVLLDVGMPGVSGIEVARDLRARPETAGARLVALTGWGQAEDRRRTREAGFDHHLTKPAGPDTVRELLAAFASAL